jgi:E3 ubiquitin-protein ligase ZNF598
MSTDSPSATFSRGSGRGRGRGGQRGPGRGRGRGGRGVGGRPYGTTPDRTSQPVPSLPSEPQEKSKSVDETEDTDGEVCFICASPVIHTSIAPCNHKTCHICSLRMRALYKTKACAHCRVSVCRFLNIFNLTNMEFYRRSPILSY